MNKIFFVTGSQDLYGEETLAQVARDSTRIAEYTEKYTMATDNIAAVREQAKYEVALEALPDAAAVLKR